MKPSARAAALLAPLAVSAAFAAGCGGGDRSATHHTATSTSNSTASDPSGLVALQRDYRQIVHRVAPSVVQITTRRGLGSGIVFDDQGHIVTNAHVVEGASALRVTQKSGHSTQARLVGRWVPGDLAVIDTDAGGLHPAAFADSSKLAVGDIAVAVGNPLGLRSSVTQGIVSSLGRTVGEGNGVTLPTAIQTSAAINPGNSGGALAGADGKVIGIPTLAATDPQLGGGAAPGIGFAIPSNTVVRIARQLIAHGHVTRSGRAALGVRVATVTGGGLLVVSVENGGPADAAGIRAGDIVVSVDGTATPRAATLSELLAKHKPGDTVSVRVRSRDGSTSTHRVTLGDLAG